MLCLYQEFFLQAPRCSCFELLFKTGAYPSESPFFFENVNSLELALIANEGIHIGFKEFYHNYGERLKMFPLSQ